MCLLTVLILPEIHVPKTRLFVVSSALPKAMPLMRLKSELLVVMLKIWIISAKLILRLCRKPTVIALMLMLMLKKNLPDILMSVLVILPLMVR